MLAPLALPLMTWRETVVGMKATESVQMEIRRTWEIRPKNVPNSPVNAIQSTIERTPGGVNSETLGFVRWRMKDAILFDKPVKVLTSEAYDKKAGVFVLEEVYTNPPGDIVRQYEERRTERGKETADAAFYPDRIEITRVDLQGKSRFAEMNPADGMESIQRRFKPLEGSRKEFTRLDGLNGTFHKVVVEKVGHFRGNWSGEKYEGSTFRFTIDGVEQTLMMTPEEETVAVDFSKEVSLVLTSPTKSRRKGG